MSVMPLDKLETSLSIFSLNLVSRFRIQMTSVYNCESCCDGGQTAGNLVQSISIRNIKICGGRFDSRKFFDISKSHIGNLTFEDLPILTLIDHQDRLILIVQQGILLLVQIL